MRRMLRLSIGFTCVKLICLHGSPSRIVVLILIGLIAACAPKPPPIISLEQATDQVVTNLRIFKTPEASRDAPSPVVIFVHGASDKNWGPEYDRWVTRIVNEGFSLVFIDLYTGRGSDGQAARSGRLLPKETAGDLMIALDWTLDQNWVDQSRVYAIGNSFGGATIMDAMVYDAPGKTPLGLTAKPSNGMNGLSKVALIAPLCIEDIMGFNVVASVHEDFYSNTPTLAIIPEKDNVSDPNLCQQIFARNKALGKPIDVMVVMGAGHTFMVSEDDYGAALPNYDEDVAARAWARTFDFFRN